MDKHDPAKKVGLYVDEWGTWYDVESGTNPGFLFQQNTMRDAIVAGLNLNVFHKHADRVRMTNIAQMINVLQAMVLTDKEKMLLTPTYHVFEMYKPFQNATLLPTELTTPDYKLGEVAIPAVSVSAARGADGALVLSLVNTDPNKPARVTAKISGAAAKKMSARVLTTPAMNAHNTFDAPERRAAGDLYGRQGKGRWLGVRPASQVRRRRDVELIPQGTRMNLNKPVSLLLAAALTCVSRVARASR
jgi:alpha-N-arabinofuranosidase